MTETGDEPFSRSETPFTEVMFEVVSAFRTVGLSTGITPRLSVLGKFILVLVMFVGLDEDIQALVRPDSAVQDQLRRAVKPLTARTAGSRTVSLLVLADFR